MPDPRVERFAVEIRRTMGCDLGVARETAVAVLKQMDAAGLVVTDPLSAPYSLVTHEYPPTLAIAKAQIDYLANTNHALHMHLAAAWEKGFRAGQELEREDPASCTGLPSNPYRTESERTP